MPRQATRRLPTASAVRCPTHLPADQAAVWAALRLAMDAAGSGSASVDEVAVWLRAIDPVTASRPLRVELLLEGLVVDPRTSVSAVRALGGGDARYAM